MLRDAGCQSRTREGWAYLWRAADMTSYKRTPPPTSESIPIRIVATVVGSHLISQRVQWGSMGGILGAMCSYISLIYSQSDTESLGFFPSAGVRPSAVDPQIFATSARCRAWAIHGRPKPVHTPVSASCPSPRFPKAGTSLRSFRPSAISLNSSHCVLPPCTATTTFFSGLLVCC